MIEQCTAAANVLKCVGGGLFFSNTIAGGSKVVWTVLIVGADLVALCLYVWKITEAAVPQLKRAHMKVRERFLNQKPNHKEKQSQFIQMEKMTTSPNNAALQEIVGDYQRMDSTADNPENHTVWGAPLTRQRSNTHT